MKTVFINGSPKKRFSVSSYFLNLQSIFVSGQNVFLKLRTKSDHKKIFEQIINADIVIFQDGIGIHAIVFQHCFQDIFCSHLH